MADYYPLLAKAVSGQTSSTPESRHAIYERARKALLGQLKAMQPPAPEAAIQREAQALDDAIARLEREFDLFPSGKSVAEPAAEPPAPPASSPIASQNSPEIKRSEKEQPPKQAPFSEKPPEPPKQPAISNRQPAGLSDEDEGEEEQSFLQSFGAPRDTLRPAAPKPERGESGGLQRLAIILGALAVVVGMVGFAAWKLRDRPEDLARLAPAPEASEQSGGKIGERVGSGQDARNAQVAPAGDASTAPIAYRSAVLLQAPSEPGGVKTYVGTVTWRRDSANRGPNQQLASAVRADVDIPDARFKMSMTMEKNYEAALSVSHTFTIRFEPGPDSPIGDVKAINMPEMRRDDAPKGTPLQGLPVDIAPNVFLIGLAAASETQNVDLLRGVNWFDIPMSLGAGRVAKVTFEKGAGGDKVVSDVLNEWKAQ
jgi:hypothetical protein